MERDRDRAVEFLRAFAVRIARDVEELPFGVAVFDERLHRVWDLNTVVLDSVPRALTGERLAALADELQGGAGLEHRQVLVLDEEGGERLAAELLPLGWEIERHVLMALRREPDRADGRDAAAETGFAWKRRFSELYLREDGDELDDVTIEQLIARDELVAGAGGRVFGVDVGRSPAAACDLYAGGDVAQIENVVTRPAYRNRGLARAVVLAAGDAARRDRRQLVFLVADEGDWVPALYRKLGFEGIGRLWLARRRPASERGVRPPRRRARARARPS